MGKKIHLKGKVFFSQDDTTQKNGQRGQKNKTQRFDFQISVPLHSMAETLMGNFTGLKFGREEKRLLTREARKKIQQFQDLNSRPIPVQRAVAKFIKKLSTYKERPLFIWADGIGAYLCLVAIVSGELPQSNLWQFKLDSIPLALFPASLIKDRKAIVKQKIQFTFEQNCWPHPFKKLYRIPRHLRSVGLEKIQILGQTVTRPEATKKRLRKAA